MDQLSLFDNRETTSPLASRIRPDTLDGFVGQKHLIGEGKVLRNLIEKDQVTSMIFWGPPGVGKTTLARIIAGKTRSSFIDFSAVTSGIKEIKTVMEQAEKNRSMGIRTILFVDEIHRFNKAQQDAFLPYVEKGSIILIGATTENPSFEINSALLSRCKVFVLKALTAEELAELLAAVVKSPKGFGNQHVQISKEQLFFIANFANGDARTALTPWRWPFLTENWTVPEHSASQIRCLNSVPTKNHFSMIKKGKNITILSLPFTSPCATVIPMPPFTGWPECWRPEKTRSMWPAD